jgi:hypothetical protein
MRRFLLDSLLLVILILVILIGSGTKGFCQKEKAKEMQYIPQILFTLNYGKEDNQVAILGEGDVEGEIGGGPSRYFAVDREENIYIVEMITIKKFSKIGQLLFTINKKGDCRVDEGGNIYVVRSIGVDEFSIDKYGKDGKFLYTIDYDPWEHIYRKGRVKKTVPTAVPRFTGPPLLVDSNGREYKVNYTIDENLNVKEVRIEVHGKVQDKVHLRTPGREITEEPIGSFTLFSTISPETAQRKQASIITTGKVNIPDYKDLKYGLRVDYVDGEGNIYASGLARRKNPLILKEEYSYGCNRKLYINDDIIVYKYDPQGMFITQIRFPDVPTVVTGVGEGYVVDASGNIYCLQFHKDGMDVVKYEWKAIAEGEGSK